MTHRIATGTPSRYPSFAGLSDEKRNHPSLRFVLSSGQHSVFSDKALAMNKKVQKQLEVAKKKLASLQLQLAGAKKQPDDPADVPRLEKELAAVHAEITKLKSAE
jgi:hypothetical protein